MHSTKYMILKENTACNLASRIVPSTSSALIWIQWSWLGMRGIGVGPETGYGLGSIAKQLN